MPIGGPTGHRRRHGSAPATRSPITRSTRSRERWQERAGTPPWHGRARLDEARAAIDERTALVTVMHSNNETGVLQPVAELAKFAHAAGAIVHTDAAQSIGKVPVRARELGVDLLSLADHKLYAPKGVGALYGAGEVHAEQRAGCAAARDGERERSPGVCGLRRGSAGAPRGAAAHVRPSGPGWLARPGHCSESRP
ncbi:MAG: aminotransferase class V-fold PLP-dependent enzyme [Myxococcales bacterium]|nr:aminotransferase class V-fold PLP-dependent enzyme [Myxococcales bacterium]